jgi:RNA polymerase sigma-70 factor (ECF subfamily)
MGPLGAGRRAGRNLRAAGDVMTDRKDTRLDHRARRAQWMARAQRGDETAYRALLNDIGPVVLSFLSRRIPDLSDLEDAYQETLVALHRARHTYLPSRPLEPWLFAIAKNVAADHARRRRRRAGREILVDALPDQPVEPERDLRARLTRALNTLPPAQREALEMLKVEGLTVAEAATRAGTTTGALKVRAHRAYAALRAAFRT